MGLHKSKVLLINLDRSKERLMSCSDQLSQQNIAFERISAVDGAQLMPAELTKITAPLFSGYYKELSAGEIGCYLSHRKCWQYICDQQLDYAVILEDDFTAQNDFNMVHQYLRAVDSTWDCIKLMEHPEKRRSVYSLPCLDKTLVRYNKVPSRTCAYAITLQGARKMLKHSEKISRPVDIDFQYWWEKDLLVYGLKPYVIKVNEGQSSTIDAIKKRKTIRKSTIKQYVQMAKFNWLNVSHLKKLDKPIV